MVDSIIEPNSGRHNFYDILSVITQDESGLIVLKRGRNHILVLCLQNCKWSSFSLNLEMLEVSELLRSISNFLSCQVQSSGNTFTAVTGMGVKHPWP